ncbi:MAG TPA: AI-2E family transporter [Bacteroidota bacterium]|jgi:predicted PurR-regulated permease PerM|nr:AI-2E family transporter [Bacteroidota bacterium]
MIEPNSPHRGTRILLIAAALVIIMYGINEAQSVVSLILASAFLALLGTSPVLWLERKRVPSLLAVLIVMASMITLLLIIGGVVGVSLNTLSQTLPLYEARLQEQILALKPFLASKHIVVSDKVLLEYLNPGLAMDLVVGVLARMGTLLSSGVLVLLTVIFILLEAPSFPVKLRSVLGNPYQNFPQYTTFVDDIKRYMVIKTVLNLAGAVLVTLWLYVLGVDFPILWGFLAFLLHFVPNLGSVLAAIPPVLLALIQLGPGSAALVAAGYLTIGFSVGNVVEPRLMGRRFGLSTLVVFLSLIFWGSLLGPIGVVLCVPLTMTLKFAFESSKTTQWVATLLASEQPSENIPPASKKGNRSSVLRRVRSRSITHGNF